MVIVALTVAHALYAYYAGFVLFLLVVVYVVVLRYIFSAIGENNRALNAQLELVRRIDANTSVIDSIVIRLFCLPYSYSSVPG